MSAARAIVADITTLNLNVMFELGYAVGLRKPVIPIRDLSYARDKRLLEEIGIFDVIGYQDFQGSEQLSRIFAGVLDARPIKLSDVTPSLIEPTYLVRCPYDLDAATRVVSAIKKSAFYRFRAFDPAETARLSVYEAFKQVSLSFGVLVHMIDPSREGSVVHNARCAFVAGISCALGKRTLMLQEGLHKHPIDYRELVVPYDTVRVVNSAVSQFVRDVADAMSAHMPRSSQPIELLERLDLGDTAAENEITSLTSYFVKTPQYQQARKGHARLVVGRKGSGKTAVFYAVRAAVKSRNSLIIDLKPDGHHFTKLREQVLDHLREGVQLHTLTSFWSYLLLLEVAKKVLDAEQRSAWNNNVVLESFRELKAEYERHALDTEGDFSERIMALVATVTVRFPGAENGLLQGPQITQMIYQRDIARLRELVTAHLAPYEDVWLLFDNIDKGWSSAGATRADIAVVRSLLDATRKLQDDLNRVRINFHSIVFLRKDIYELLADQTPDRGKESVASLDWSDEQLLEELLKRRFERNPEVSGDFRQIWARFFPAHVGSEDSFRYMIARSLYQPRAVLNFVSKCLQVAVGRDHRFVAEEDILTAEKAFSEDMFKNLHFEIRDVRPQYHNILQGFVGYAQTLAIEDITLIASQAGVQESDIPQVLDALMWFAFIGPATSAGARYSYEMSYDLGKLKALQRGIPPEKQMFAVHPAYHKALEIG
jgi:hypothetical protein